MDSRNSLRALAAATPLALAAILAAAPQASAAIAGADVQNPHVINHGRTLSIVFDSAVSNQSADTAAAQQLADSLVGNWAGGLIEYAMQHAPAQSATPDASTCHLTATATDPNGARGTATAEIPAGVTSTTVAIPDQAPGTAWGVGDVDQFSMQLTCTDTQRGAQMGKATIVQDETATAS